MDFIGNCIDLWRRLRLTPARYPNTKTVTRRSDLPQNLHRRILYIIGNSTDLKWIIFMCPCGRNHQIDLSTSSEPTVAQWRLDDEKRSPTIHPSVDIQANRRCHFWLRDGSVYWV
ncbi:MAG: DUF6527 family protein [Ilumatobacteraceae bacterium]